MREALGWIKWWKSCLLCLWNVQRAFCLAGLYSAWALALQIAHGRAWPGVGGEHLGWSPAVLWGRSGQGPAASSLWAQEDVTQQHRWEDSSAGAVEMCPRRESVCLLCVPGRLCSRPLLLWTGSSFLLASVPEVTKRALSRLSSGGSAPGWLSV